MTYSGGRDISVDKQRQSRNQQQSCRDQEAAVPPSCSQQQDKPTTFTVNICSAKLNKFTPIEGCAKGVSRVLPAWPLLCREHQEHQPQNQKGTLFAGTNYLFLITHTALLPPSIEPESNAFSQQHVEGTIETANKVCFLDAGKVSVK